MTRNIKNYRTHDFYCLNCGKRNISVMRPRGFLRERRHRKAMYCPHCKLDVNHLECRNDEDAFNFKIDFEEGKYIQEAKESINFLMAEKAEVGNNA